MKRGEIFEKNIYGTTNNIISNFRVCKNKS